MKSITKHRLTREQITHLVKVNFGDSCEVGTITELKGGFFNTAYLIERLREQDQMVLKVSVAEGTRLLSYEVATMYTEVEVYRLISEQTTIPAPKVLASDFSRRDIPSDYFFMTYMKGEAMTKVKLSKNNKEEIDRELAGYFAQLHQIKGSFYGYFKWKTKQEPYSSWKDAFLGMMGMILSDGKEHGIKLPYDSYEKQMKEKAHYFEAITSPVLVDYDLHPGNIFLKKQGDSYVIEGIVDFERAFWGDPYADFPAAFLMAEDIRRRPVFWEEYRKQAGIDHDITKEEEIRYLFYRLYIFTIMAVEIYRYGFLYSRVQSYFSMKVVRKCLDQLEQLK